MAIDDVRDEWTCTGCKTSYRVIDAGVFPSTTGHTNKCGICGTIHTSPEGDLYVRDPDGRWRKEVSS